MDQQAREGIQRSEVFLIHMPEGGLEGTGGEEQMLYAMSLGKPVMVWRQRGCGHLTIPPSTAHYTDVQYIDGDKETMERAVLAFLELTPEEQIVLTTGEWEG